MEQGYIETLPDGRKCEFRVKGIHIISEYNFHDCQM